MGGKRSLSEGRTLGVIPYVGEFGWELMNWQGRVRWMIRRREYRYAYIYAAADRRALYEDLIREGLAEFRHVNVSSIPGVPNEDHRIDEAGRQVTRAILAREVWRSMEVSLYCVCGGPVVSDWLWPSYNGHLWPTSDRYQVFRSLDRGGRRDLDYVLVPRWRTLATERNQTWSWWNELRERLQAMGATVEVLAPPLDRAIGLLSRARLAIGASTGGLHLASLCECPHYVWGSSASQRWTRWGMSNMERYEVLWNPLGTPCIYDECGWQPDVRYVASCAQLALKTIGRGAAGGRQRLLRRVKWRAGRALAAIRLMSLRTACRERPGSVPTVVPRLMRTWPGRLLQRGSGTGEIRALENRQGARRRAKALSPLPTSAACFIRRDPAGPGHCGVKPGCNVQRHGADPGKGRQ